MIKFILFGLFISQCGEPLLEPVPAKTAGVEHEKDYTVQDILKDVKVGDVLSMKGVDLYAPVQSKSPLDHPPKARRVRRSISMYGQPVLKPFEKDSRFEVTEIKAGIPYPKGRSVEVVSLEKRIYVKKFDSQSKVLILWAINVETGMIEQFEDGAPTHRIDSITIHDD